MLEILDKAYKVLETKNKEITIQMKKIKYARNTLDFNHENLKLNIKEVNALKDQPTVFSSSIEFLEPFLPEENLV